MIYYLIFFVLFLTLSEHIPKNYSDRLGGLVFLPIVVRDYFKDYYFYGQTLLIVLSIVIFVVLLLKKKTISSFLRIIFLGITSVFLFIQNLNWAYFIALEFILYFIFILGALYESIVHFKKVSLIREKFAIVFVLLGGIILIIASAIEVLNIGLTMRLFLIGGFFVAIGILPELIVGLYQIGEEEEVVEEEEME